MLEMITPQQMADALLHAHEGRFEWRYPHGTVSIAQVRIGGPAPEWNVYVNGRNFKCHEDETADARTFALLALALEVALDEGNLKRWGVK